MTGATTDVMTRERGVGTAIVEREVLMTGIGGQGVQLAARILALAATRDGREVMSLGTYGGTMRGGNTDATVVIGDGALTSPPIVSSAWSVVVMHPRFADPLLSKLRPGGVVLADEDLLDGPIAMPSIRTVSIPATTIAREVESPRAVSLVLLGAFASLTGIVGPESLKAALASSLPSYRQEFLESNCRALVAGAEALPAMDEPAWTSRAA
jgi:2-oxoglutarate ferredoxin oxidoreductase subunit gamma